MISTWGLTVLSTGIALSATSRAVRFRPPLTVPLQRGLISVFAQCPNHLQKSFLTSGSWPRKSDIYV